MLYTIVLMHLLTGLVAFGQVNSWTKPTSGAWEEPVWSLGILPNSSQTIEITNAGFKAVGINPATATGFPGSLTINHLDISAPINSSNTLLLNFFGASPPLRVINGVNVGTGGRILDLFSGLLVDAGGLSISNGSVAQNGGFLIVGDVINVNGTYNLTNGLVQAPNILVGGGNNVSLFTQVGGSNSTSDLVVRGASAPARYDLSGGALTAGSEEIFSGSHTALGTFNQTGGRNTVTNTLRLEGAAIDRDPFGPSVALYILNDGGQLSAATLLLGPYSSFAQSNGTTTVSGTVQFNTLSPFFLTTSFLAGGTLSAANVGFAGAGENLVQTGGTLTVTNLFSFGGFTASPPLGFALYDFVGGRLNATNIEILGNLSIGSAGGQTRRITNPGFFRLGAGGTVTTATIDERLGRFILASSAAIDMGAGASKLAFADSSSEAWAAGAILSVLNWSGSTNGGGSDQLFFGTNANGLTLTQLGQIRFVNPAGFPPGSTNFARILNTGEVVPSVQPVLVATKQGTMLRLEWPETFKLLSATNVLGPYLPVSGAVSPYTIDTKTSPQGFFRLSN